MWQARLLSTRAPGLRLLRWEDKGLPGHDWQRMLEAKRKELQRLNGAYKNTLNNAKARSTRQRRAAHASTAAAQGGADPHCPAAQRTCARVCPQVTVLEGRGKVLDAHTVEVDGKRYTARNIVVAVGNRPSKLSIPGAELTITSDDALELQQRPK